MIRARIARDALSGSAEWHGAEILDERAWQVLRRGRCDLSPLIDPALCQRQANGSRATGLAKTRLVNGFPSVPGELYHLFTNISADCARSQGAPCCALFARLSARRRKGDLEGRQASDDRHQFTSRPEADRPTTVRHARVRSDKRPAMTINLKMPDIRELKPRITVFGVGGAGGNAVNNMITAGLVGCDFVVANTDAQALTLSKAERIIQMGLQVTEGSRRRLAARRRPRGRRGGDRRDPRSSCGRAHGVRHRRHGRRHRHRRRTDRGARRAKELGILTVGVVTKPFHFEGVRRMRVAEEGITELQKAVDTLLIIPNQNLFRVANEKTTFADAFAMADQVLYSGVACITDLMVKEGLINLDFADVRAVMREMGKAMMGTGEASGDKRALSAAEAAISNPLIDETSMKGAKGLLISITGGKDLTLYEVDEAATRIREEVDSDANIIVGATFDESLDGIVRVSVVATGIDVAIVGASAGHARQRSRRPSRRRPRRRRSPRPRGSPS